MLEWIALQVRRARANRIVIDYCAECVLAAGSNARVDASLSQTGHAELTIGIPQTFWPAARVVVAIFIGAWIANSDSAAVCVARVAETAWRWLARCC